MSFFKACNSESASTSDLRIFLSFSSIEELERTFIARIGISNIELWTSYAVPHNSTLGILFCLPEIH